MSKITQLARGESCVRCGVRDGTVVAAHLNGPLASILGRGLGKKPHDLFCADLCVRCHDVFDGRVRSSEITEDEIEAEWPRLVLLTINRRIEPLGL